MGSSDPLQNEELEPLYSPQMDGPNKVDRDCEFSSPVDNECH